MVNLTNSSVSNNELSSDPHNRNKYEASTKVYNYKMSDLTRYGKNENLVDLIQNKTNDIYNNDDSFVPYSDLNINKNFINTKYNNNNSNKECYNNNMKQYKPFRSNSCNLINYSNNKMCIHECTNKSCLGQNERYMINNNCEQSEMYTKRDVNNNKFNSDMSFRKNTQLANNSDVHYKKCEENLNYNNNNNNNVDNVNFVYNNYDKTNKNNNHTDNYNTYNKYNDPTHSNYNNNNNNDYNNNYYNNNDYNNNDYNNNDYKIKEKTYNHNNNMSENDHIINNKSELSSNTKNYIPNSNYPINMENNNIQHGDGYKTENNFNDVSHNNVRRNILQNGHENYNNNNNNNHNNNMNNVKNDNIHNNSNINSYNNYPHSDISSVAHDEFIHSSASINRERNMKHTIIFDYVENEKDKNINKEKNKKQVNTFVPKYNNLSPKEIHYNSLCGNDNITILEANKIKLDLNKLSEEDKRKKNNELPDQYPFHLCNEFKNDMLSKNKPTYVEKIYPTNYQYINNYNKNNEDISIEQRRYNMNSSHIFDYCLDTNHKKIEKNSIEKKKKFINEIKKPEQNSTDIEKEQKRKINPMYSDLFGRKTPDVNENITYEKIIPTTINSNWIYCPIDARKYSDGLYYKSSDNLENNKKENFHRKSFFKHDGYDNTKRLQDAIKRGSKVSLQAHLQSALQNDMTTYIPTDYHNVEAIYLSLSNLKDSVTDEQIKKIIKNSGAHIVSYIPEYDLFSNRRKSNAKLCIRYNMGNNGLNLLLNMFEEVNIKAQII
ncbi:hypothetical protein PGSY75_0522100 [Plasmodium gaboni]|uniref:Uncharacterized protein n=1 Tax=Plasmodium gaboni TaxID=647221 RepID=A0A151LTC2_9APIC|nr:hypothetical protein PGSY75_0522100 [Plasmodium gaboni]KYO02417.1 hypothetical protein PGSY75_0522100 [Plasmodium gaboni]